MAEPEGTTGLDESADESEALEGIDAREEPAEEGEEGEQAEAAAEPPRRRLVSELLEGQEAFIGRADLQLVAPPLHIEVGDSGQPIYQLDLSSDEPEGTLLEPERSPEDDESDYRSAPAAGAAGGSAVGGAHATVRQMVAHRDRQVMAAERDGVGAYELASGIDDFVARIIEVIRSSG